MAELAREEADELSAALEAQGERLKFLLLPKDPLDDKNIMLEVCAVGAGVGRGVLLGRGQQGARMLGAVWSGLHDHCSSINALLGSEEGWMRGGRPWVAQPST
jgi:hypothetical protein